MCTAVNSGSYWPMKNSSQRIAQFETRYLDADLHQELASDLGVRGLPTLLLITSGQPISRAPTQYSVASLLNWLNSVSL